ncbi:hypothetical protein M6D81_13865 [Paenibacillus sp. J5C_2022]|uniref:hypothetical protein n=1 Tax=Paenibacillus sp. J5C2022 TaxID=2977129 RepID=UPI0021D06511|nr:hypothetical protein [Paenibacillus sp. J5C2022]MCU6709779.1 hypothetical protein [Paenibacillus sp. J5C2022]
MNEGINKAIAADLTRYLTDIDAVLKSDAAPEEKREIITLAARCIVLKLEGEYAELLPDLEPYRELIVGMIVKAVI